MNLKKYQQSKSFFNISIVNIHISSAPSPYTDKLPDGAERFPVLASHHHAVYTTFMSPDIGRVP